MFFFKNWFLPENIVHFFPIIASSIFVGNGIGAYLPFIFIKENETDKDLIKTHFIQLCQVLMICGIVNFLLSLFFFKDKDERLHHKPLDYTWSHFVEETKTLFKNKTFIMFLFIIAFGRGNLLLIFTNMGIFFKKIHYE